MISAIFSDRERITHRVVMLAKWQAAVNSHLRLFPRRKCVCWILFSGSSTSAQPLIKGASPAWLDRNSSLAPF